MTNLTPIEQPRAGRGDVAFIDPDGNWLFRESDGLGNICSNGVHRIDSEVQVPVVASSRNNGQNGGYEPVQDAALCANFDFDHNFPPRPSTNPPNIAAERQKGHCEIAISDPFLNDFQDNLDDVFGMYLPDQGIDWSGSLETKQTTSAPGSKMHSSDEFNQDNCYNIFDIGVPSLEIDPSNSPETSPNAPSNNQDASYFPILLDQNTLNDALNIDIQTLEMDLSDSLEMSPNPPSSSQDASFSSNLFDQHFPNGVDTSNPEFNLPDRLESTLDDLSVSQAKSFSSSSNESDFSTYPSTPTRRSPATTPSSTGSPGRHHSCNHCNSAFKRLSDRNRHAKVHFPGQRTFHCTHLGCERKGRKAFYRKDKLKDHEKQAHGFISLSSFQIQS
ncbi:hypothetical protein BDZ45DRAFT_755682 [Acephala macrosclerotiorum]|nr:hypothetical protein BDZ45DRAFT_755682 [Acephala macrosclerotiorum]